MLGWFKPVRDKFLVFWLQCSQDGWDTYTGSSFCVEFQFSDVPCIGGGSSDVRYRLPHFLKTEELEEIRQKQNFVIAKLVYPPSDYYIFQMSHNVTLWYQKKFASIEVGYADRQDIWLRYKDEEDVVMWAKFVLHRLPTVLAQLVAD